MPSDIVEGFSRYFEMLPAIDSELKKEVYHLRYQVYCLETRFENPDHFPDGLEIDEADAYSLHYLIRHRSKGTAASTRLVMPAANNEKRKFPIEKHCVIDNLRVIENIPRNELAEVSRFCVSKEFKQRKGELGTLNGVSDNPDDYFSDDERRVFPHITLALIACLIKMSHENDIHYWYAVMEPSLLRFLKMLGIYFTQIGPITEYHGKRIPNVIKVSDLLDGVYQKNREVWSFLTDRGRILID